MVEFSSVLATMWPSLQYAGCWHAYYWAGHVTFSALWGAYTTPSSESHDFYVKKLRLKGLHDAEARRATRGYFQNYFLTSFLAATHGVIMGVLLVPFIWEHSAFLTEAVVSSTTDDPRVMTACMVFTGYVANDFLFCFPMMLRYWLADDILFVVHHVTLVLTWVSFATDSWGHLFAVPTMLTEMTAPLVLASWCLKEFRLTKHVAFTVVGIALLVAWYVLRIYGYCYFLTARLFELRVELFAAETLRRNVPVLCFHLLGCGMQLHWGKGLTMIAIRAFSSKAEPKGGDKKGSKSL